MWDSRKFEPFGTRNNFSDSPPFKRKQIYLYWQNALQPPNCPHFQTWPASRLMDLEEKH